jgi:hypothetical protein
MGCLITQCFWSQKCIVACTYSMSELTNAIHLTARAGQSCVLHLGDASGIWLHPFHKFLCLFLLGRWDLRGLTSMVTELKIFRE